MRIRSPFLAVTAAVLALGVAWVAAPAAPSDRPTTHNMLVVGEKTAYLSHLPMFQMEGEPPMPHRYQAILEVAFTGAGDDPRPQQAYAEDREKHPDTTVYTLNPRPFVLPGLVAADPVRSLKATVFRGHLEKLRKGEGPILRNVNVQVQRVVYFKEFDPKAKKPAGLEYLLFGKGKELFLAHLIVAPPDFDQVLAVTVTGQDFSDADLSHGVRVSFPDLKNSPHTRLKAEERAEGKVEMKGGADPAPVRVAVARELYFEEGELRVPPEFQQTPEEKAAGFP